MNDTTTTTEACGIPGRPNILIDRQRECVGFGGAPEALRAFRFRGNLYAVLYGTDDHEPNLMRITSTGFRFQATAGAEPTLVAPAVVNNIEPGDKIAFNRVGDVWTVAEVPVAADRFGVDTRPTLVRC